MIQLPGFMSLLAKIQKMSDFPVLFSFWLTFLVQALNKNPPVQATITRKRQGEDNTCDDIVLIKDCDYSGKLNFFRIKTNQLVAHFESKCKFDSIRYRWQVTDSSQHEPVIDREDDNVFVLSPFTLREDANAINLIATVIRGEKKSETHAGCELHSVALEPIPSIEGGSEVTVEPGQSFELDASKSIDRDVPLNATKKLVYKWSCRVVEDQTKDFCLKTYQGSLLRVPSSYAINNHKYTFTLSVRNPASENWVSSTQTVTVLRNVASLDIVCEKNCPPAVPISDSKRLTFLRVKCLKNCGQVSKDSYEWSVEGSFDYDKTQFGRNTDKFVVKEGVLEYGKNYTVRVKLKNRDGTAGMVLRVPSPLRIESCGVNPKEGLAGETKFTVDCKYSGDGSSFEIVSTKDGRSVVLTENYLLENVEFLLPPQSQLFIKITDINGFQDTYKLNVKVQPSSKQVSSLLASIKDSINKGDTDSAIQTINAIVDQVTQPDTMTVLKDLDQIAMKSLTTARQVASIVAKLANKPDSKSDPYRGEIATKICKKASEIDLENLRAEHYPTSLTLETRESTQTLISCGETDSKENLETLKPVPLRFNVTTPLPVLDVPVIAEDYPDYDDDDSVTVKRSKFDGISKNVLDICENSLQMLNLTVVEGEETIVTTSNSTSAQITRLAGDELSKTEIEIQGASFLASQDFSTIKEAIDVMVCSWNYDPFWWNPSRTIVSTGVLSIKLMRNGKEEKTFNRPNRIVLDLKSQRLKSVQVGMEVPIRIDVRKNESFFVQFHGLSEVDSFTALVTNFEKPDQDRVKREGRTVTKGENVLYREEDKGYDSWYYLTLASEKVTNRATVWISVSTKSCYYWDFNEKSWGFGCQGGPHSNEDKMECLCTHFSILAGVIYNNRFKIDEITTNLDFEMVLIRSFVILITLCISFFIYCLLIAITSSSMQKQSKIVYLPGDISSSSRFVYLIGIQTGTRPSSGTSSNICMKLYGDKSRSKSHVLNYPDPRKKIFQRNSRDWFILPTRHYLGNLLEVVLWSDFSGRHPRWFCSHVVVHDVQNDKEWYFEVEAWLDLPPKGELVRKVTVSEKKWRRRKFALSVFPKRTHQEGFSGMRRLTLLWSILLTIFLTCLLIYGLPTLTLRDGFAKPEEYAFDSGMILIGLTSSVITFSSHMILTFLFRSDTGKNLAWALLSVNIIASMTVLVIYGFWVPRVTGYSWLTSVLISVVAYFLICENLYDLLTNCYQRKASITLERDLKKVLRAIEEQRAHLFRTFGENVLRPYFGHLYRPMDDDDVKECKRRIQIRNQLLALLEDTLMFMCYVTLLYLAIFANRNTMTVGNHHQMVELLSGTHTRTSDYGSIDSVNGIYEYINETLIPTMHGHRWYSHFVIKDPGLMLDFHNKFLGVARLRQRRVAFAPCPMKPNETCRQDFWYSDESKERFGSGDGTLGRLSQIWNYTSSKSAGISVHVGKFGIYHGGGFVAPLGRTLHNSYANLLYLKDHDWIDDASSVIIIEFLAYNVNTNLFNAVKIVIEKSTTGYFLSRLDLSTAQFLFVNSEERTVHVVIFLSFVAVVGIFSLKLVARIVKGKLLVLTDLWTLVDLIIIGLSFASFFVFVHRGETVREFLDKVETVKKNEFINYFNLLYEDSTFGLVGAFLVFVATVRLWKVCRFGSVFKIMENTILLSGCSISLVLFYHVIVILGYTFSGTLLFGTASEDFRDIPDTLLTLMLLIVGLQNNFDFDSLISANYHLAAAYYFSYMLLNMLFLTMYVCVIMISYYEAQVSFNEEPAQIIRFLHRECKFYKTSIKMVLPRLRGGTQKRTSVTPKEDDLRYADCKVLGANTLEFMRCVAIYELKKFRSTKEEKLVLMKTVVACCGGGGENEIFFSGDSDGVRMIHDDRIRKVAAAAEMLLNYDEKKKERSEKKYKRVVDRQLVQLNFVKRVLETVSRIVANVRIE